jgi:hypothetical protein
LSPALHRPLPLTQRAIANAEVGAIFVHKQRKFRIVRLVHSESEFSAGECHVSPVIAERKRAA